MLHFYYQHSEWTALYLDALRLVVEVYGAGQGAGPGVQVEHDASCQGEQRDDGRGREGREQKLEQEVHGARSAGMQRNVNWRY